jgi:hypothetical protein
MGNGTVPAFFVGDLRAGNTGKTGVIYRHLVRFGVIWRQATWSFRLPIAMGMGKNRRN